MKTIFIGELSEKDLGLLKDFAENKYGKIISQKGFEKFLKLSTGQHALFEQGLNPFERKPLRYFDGPYVDIDIFISRTFSIEEDIHIEEMYGSVKGVINSKGFPQGSFESLVNQAKLRIVSTREDMTLSNIVNLSCKEMKGSKNFSKFLIRAFDSLVNTQAEMPSRVKGQKIIVPLFSKEKVYGTHPIHDYPIPIFVEKGNDRYKWDFDWPRIKYPKGTLVALLSQ